jgi:hypothetical protein
MIPIKRSNYITGNSSDVSYALNRIVSFLETDGRTPLLICKSRNSNTSKTSLTYLLDNKIEFDNFLEFKMILENRSNLFRVDLLIFDFWGLSVSTIIEYRSIIDKLNIDYIIVAKEYHYKMSDDVGDYHIKHEIKENKNFQSGYSPQKYYITDNISGWTSELSDLSKSWIRDKKIDQIFKDKE